jgi:hypothetical protein
MDDPKDVAEAFAETAYKVVNESQAVAVEAFKKINKDVPNQPITFTAGDAIKAITDLARIAATGGIELGQTALEVRPAKGVLILADHIATILSRGVKDVAGVASEASDLIDKDAYKRNDWVQSAIKLTNIALLHGAEIAQTVAAGPAQYADPIAKFDFAVTDAQVDAVNDRQLTVPSLKLGGPAAQDKVPDYRISFEPSDCVLRAGKKEFTLIVNSAGLPSGVYLGTIEVRRANVAAPDVTVPVTINL